MSDFDKLASYNKALDSYTDVDFEMFLYQVSTGAIEGHSLIHKFAAIGDVDTADTPILIWDYEKTYTYSTTADIDTVSSSNSSDKQTMIVQGLDENWTRVTQEVILDGQNKVVLETPLIRCFRAYNNDSTSLVGTFFCYVDSTIVAGVPSDDTKVRAIVTADSQQTLMGTYTIPSDHTGFLIGVHTTLGRNRTAVAEVSLRMREFGKVFRSQGQVVLGSNGNSAFFRDFKILPPFIEKTDIQMQVDYVSTNSVSVTSEFDLLIVDNEYLK